MNTPSDFSKLLILLTKGHYDHDYERDDLMRRAVGYICDLPGPASHLATVDFMINALKEATGRQAFMHLRDIVLDLEDESRQALGLGFDGWIHGLYSKLQGLRTKRFPRSDREEVLIDLSLEKKPIDHPAIKLEVKS